MVPDDGRFQRKNGSRPPAFAGHDLHVVGSVTVSGNVAPSLVAGMCRAVREGDADEAKKLDNLLQPLNTALFLESNPIPVKWALLNC